MRLVDLEEKINKFNSSVFSLFQTDIIELVKNKFQLLVQLHLQISESDRLSYWEYEEYIKLLNDKNKEENEQREKQEGEQSKYGNMGNLNPSSMMKNLSNVGNNFAKPRL